MTKQRFLQLLGICIAALTVFYVCLGVSASKIKKNRAAAQTTLSSTEFAATDVSSSAPSAVVTDTAPAVTIGGNQIAGTQATQAPLSTSAPTVTAVSGADPTAQSTPLPAESTTAPAAAVPSGKAAIISAYVNAVNKLKSTGDFTLVKTDHLNVVIDEMEPSSVRGMADKMIANSQDTSPKTYHFSGGSDASSGASVNHIVAPVDKSAALSESAVTAASATPAAGGGYQLHLTLGSEQQTMHSAAPNYSTVMEVIDTDTMGLPANTKIDEFTVTYNGGTIDATIDAQGRITAMQHHLVVPNGTGSGSMVVPVTVRMHGDHTATYTITY